MRFVESDDVTLGGTGGTHGVGRLAAGRADVVVRLACLGAGLANAVTSNVAVDTILGRGALRDSQWG